MKKQSNNLHNTIGKIQIENLNRSENEISASGFYKSNFKSFTAVDLWNIQRNGKSGLQKRHLF
jgi:hypothetical protein